MSLLICDKQQTTRRKAQRNAWSGNHVRNRQPSLPNAKDSSCTQRHFFPPPSGNFLFINCFVAFSWIYKIYHGYIYFSSTFRGFYAGRRTKFSLLEPDDPQQFTVESQLQGTGLRAQHAGDVTR